MSMIKAEHLTFSYPGSFDTIFEDVSFTIDTDWKLGFVGRNGRGKTTFLNLLMKKYEYSGTIVSSVPFDYFPYSVADPGRRTEEILREVCPNAEEWELLRELSYLEVSDDVLWRAFETLSGGEQTKVLLAALFLNEGRFLLIDEPTNHLDTRAREITAAYLRRKKGFILVSHDRRFLDGCVDHILSFNRADIQLESGNFSSWMENFSRQQESELAQNMRLKKDIGRLKQSARRTSQWSDQVEATKAGAYDKGLIGHKAAKMMKRAKSIEARQQKSMEEKSKLLKNLETAEPLKMVPLPYHSDTLASFSDVSVCYGGKAVHPEISFTVRSGERIALEGKNGSGKSSLLKLFLPMPPEHTGTVSAGSGIVISYVPQDASYLRGSLSDFAEERGISKTLFWAVLRKLDFGRRQLEKDMSEFSGGQKKKVLIAASLCEPAHLYLWDEPLNYIDLYSRMQVEALLLEFSPTMVFVEHDAAFRDAVATARIDTDGAGVKQS